MNAPKIFAEPAFAYSMTALKTQPTGNRRKVELAHFQKYIYVLDICAAHFIKPSPVSCSRNPKLPHFIHIIFSSNAIHSPADMSHLSRWNCLSTHNGRRNLDDNWSRRIKGLFHIVLITRIQSCSKTVFIFPYWSQNTELLSSTIWYENGGNHPYEVFRFWKAESETSTSSFVIQLA